MIENKKEYLKDIDKSNERILKHKKYLLYYTDWSDLISCENEDSIVCSLLDKKSGIDYLIKTKDNHLTTLASRIQYNSNFKSFTIRYTRTQGFATEYEKRIHEIDNGLLYPKYTLQVFEIDDKIASYCFVDTKLFYDYVRNNLEDLEIKKAPDGNTFIIVKFKNIPKTVIIQSKF